MDYQKLIGLNFEGAVKVLEENGKDFDFGDGIEYKDVLKEIEECKKEDSPLCFEGSHIFIGGYWNDNRIEVYFGDDFKVMDVDYDFEGWE